MDRHEWKHKGQRCYVADEGSRVALAVPFADPIAREKAAAAEILRLAEESEARRVYIESFEPQAVATGDEKRLRAALRAALRALEQAIGYCDRKVFINLNELPAARGARAELDEEE